jgi:DNA-binding NtrC family response regulator
MANQMLLEDQGLEIMPLILFSGFPEIDRLAEEIGTPYYISKPFEIDDLLDLVNHALKERNPPIPLRLRRSAQPFYFLNQEQNSPKFKFLTFDYRRN